PGPDELAAQARFVFKGTIKKLQASNVRIVDDKTHTVVVRVDQTIQAPQALSHYTGKDITVHLAAGAKVKVGQQTVFFTEPWLFGNEGPAVRSLGHHAPQKAKALLSAATADATQSLANL